MMLAPRISLRQLLLFMVLVAFYLALVSMACRGNIIAVGLTISVSSLLALFSIYALSYWIHYGVAAFLFGGQRASEQSENPKPVQESS